MDHYHSLEFHSVPHKCTPACGEHRQSCHCQSEVSTEIEKKHVTRCEVAVSFYFKHTTCVSKLRMYCMDFAAGKVRSYFRYSLEWCSALVAGPPEAAHRLHTSKWCLQWESVPAQGNTFHTAVMQPLSVMMRIWLMGQFKAAPKCITHDMEGG